MILSKSCLRLKHWSQKHDHSTDEHSPSTHMNRPCAPRWRESRPALDPWTGGFDPNDMGMSHRPRSHRQPFHRRARPPGQEPWPLLSQADDTSPADHHGLPGQALCSAFLTRPMCTPQAT